MKYKINKKYKKNIHKLNELMKYFLKNIPLKIIFLKILFKNNF